MKHELKWVLTSTLSAVHRVSKVSLCAALAMIALGGVLAGLVACRRLFTALAVPVALTRCKRRKEVHFYLFTAGRERELRRRER